MNKSFRSRVGNVMRRSSVILTMSRPTTPAVSDSDANSLNSQKQPETPALVVPSEAVSTHVPSPIAESPAREARALETELVGPSPLADTTIAEEVAEVPPAASTLVIAEPVVTEPASAQIPAPTMLGLEAFTDEPAETAEQNTQASQDSQKDGAEAIIEPDPQPALGAAVDAAAETPIPFTIADVPLYMPTPLLNPLPTLLKAESAEESASSMHMTPQSVASQVIGISPVTTSNGPDFNAQQAADPDSVSIHPGLSSKPSHASLTPAIVDHSAPSIAQGNGNTSYHKSNAPSIEWVFSASYCSS
jgi:hypothetical protein